MPLPALTAHGSLPGAIAQKPTAQSTSNRTWSAVG
jgi:hypothetical protein